MENSLQNKEEKVIYETGLHKWVKIWPIFLSLFFLLMIINASSAKDFGSVTFWIFFLFFGLILTLTAWLDYSHTRLSLTDKKIAITAGWVSKISYEILLDKIQGIDIEQSLLGRMLNYGLVIIRTGGKNNIKIKNIREPYLFRQKAQEQILKLSENK